MKSLAMRPRRGFFGFEGGEAAGKTSLARLVAHELRARDFTVCHTHEPGGTLLGEAVRELLLNPKFEGELIPPVSSACLFAASRRAWVEQVVSPALERGELVLADRTFLSTLVYQPIEGVESLEFLDQLCGEAMAGIMPQTIFLLDSTVEIMERRLTAVTRYDLKAREFHERVFESYRAFARGYPDRIQAVDGARPLAELALYLTENIVERYAAGFPEPH
jgi:dTMP kinase